MRIYKPSLALLTDLYEITMAYGYWKRQMASDEAVFHLFFRKKPFEGGYAIAAGLEPVIEYLESWRFDSSDLDFLAQMKAPTGVPMFEEGFLRYLEDLSFSCDVMGMREGEVVFPYEPLLRIQGPLLQAQLLETPLLTLTNFPTLIATKAARISLAAEGDSILEFGLRRAQGIDGGLSAARAAFIGGCAATSNTLAGKVYGIPVRGTHAHSWIMAFDHEKEAFQAYAEALPDNCVFLVDTYDTLDGVAHAIEVGKWLKARGKPFLGIRLDSGDIDYLSKESRKLLDAAGFPEAQIYASNELCETLIRDLKAQGAKVAVWGVGTHLVTGQSQPALGGVYKLSAIRKQGETKWKYRLKLSERMKKISDPGIIQVRRFSLPENGGYRADALYDEGTDLSHGCSIVDPIDPTRRRKIGEEMVGRDLLVPIFEKGKRVYDLPTLPDIQAYAASQLAQFDNSIKRLHFPHSYPVGMEEAYYQMKLEMIDAKRKELEKSPSYRRCAE
ncbi:MAG: Nicotinate phosphoribosyltransferase pncB2 [Chlamydiae bacterium]|nr:Nicotinate phosphoribosyltransferase pncB2 [Chlamydiota bacterium]